MSDTSATINDRTVDVSCDELLADFECGDVDVINITEDTEQIKVHELPVISAAGGMITLVSDGGLMFTEASGAIIQNGGLIL